MILSFTKATALLLALVVYFVIHRRILKSSLTHIVPPGPPGYPLIGNVFDIPAQYEWKAYSAWVPRYVKYSLSLAGIRSLTDQCL